MAYIAYALPIVPGGAERAGNFGAELTPEHHAHYEALNRRAKIRRHMEWVQSTPMGDLLIVVFETDAPETVGRPFEDNAYDRAWISRIKAIHGFDPTDAAFEPVIPKLVWDWTDEVATGHS
jgi:hypothetical protein